MLSHILGSLSNVPSLLGIFIAQLLASGGILSGFCIPFLLSIAVSYDAYSRIQSSKNAKTAQIGCIIGGILVIIELSARIPHTTSFRQT